MDMASEMLEVYTVCINKHTFHLMLKPKHKMGSLCVKKRLFQMKNTERKRSFLEIRFEDYRFAGQ